MLRILCILTILLLNQYESSAQLKKITYGDSNEHARAICSYKKAIYLGTNLGRIYKIKGKKVKKISPKDYPEIRDIQVNRGKLYVMQTGDTGRMICYQLAFRKTPKLLNEQLILIDDQNVFLDGFHINGKSGFLMGDPINGNFSLFNFNQKDNSWKILPKLVANEGEAAFAASGTTVFCEKNYLSFVSGGLVSRYHYSTDGGNKWQSVLLPFESCESCGAYSMATLPKNKKSKNDLVFVGGNYKYPEDTLGSCFYGNSSILSFEKPHKTVSGYKSCIMYDSNSKCLFSGGTNGIDYSYDAGKNWSKISDLNCYTLTTNKRHLIISSNNGSIYYLKLHIAKENND